jgi:hypothetical protein
MSRFTFTRVLAVVALGFTFMLAGCNRESSTGSKLSKDNLAKLKEGMTQAQVEEILGPGDVGGTVDIGKPGRPLPSKTEVWKDGPKSITVVYANEKVKTITSNNL